MKCGNLIIRKEKKKKFTELIPVKEQKIAVKHMEITKPVKNKILLGNDSVENILKGKLLYLAQRLDKESDLRNIEEIMKAMNLMMDTILHYKKIQNNNN